MLIEDAEVAVVNKRNIEIAKNALKKGLSVDIVKDITGLDELAIENLQLEISYN
jgi:hypothetical protein